MITTLISDVCALFLLWIFAQAAIHKLNKQNNSYYRDLVTQYLNPPKTLTTQLSTSITSHKPLWMIKVIGIAELILSLLVVMPTSRALAAVIIAMLLMVYLLLMAYQLQQGKRDMRCGCSGAASQLKISYALVLRNACFTLMAFACVFWENNLLTSSMLSSSTMLSMTVVALAIALICIAINAIVEQLIVNQQQLKLLKL